MNKKSCHYLIIMVVILFAFPLSGLAYADKLSQDEKIRIWKYYTQFEDIYGIDKAGTLTVKKFAINLVELESIKSEGRTRDWPLPSQERELDYYTDISESLESGRLETELCNSVEETDADSSNGWMAGELLNKNQETRL